MAALSRITVRHYIEDLQRGTPPVLITREDRDIRTSGPDETPRPLLSAGSPQVRLPPGTYRLLTVVDVDAEPGSPTHADAQPWPPGWRDLRAIQVDTGSPVWRGVLWALVIEFALALVAWMGFVALR